MMFVQLLAAVIESRQQETIELKLFLDVSFHTPIAR